MAGISGYLAKALLDHTLDNNALAAPGSWSIALATGAPTSLAASELALTTNMSRQSLSMATASSPAGSISNGTAATFGTAPAAATISGITIWNTMSSTNGSFLYYGTLATPRTLASGDSLVFAVGSVVVTLA